MTCINGKMYCVCTFSSVQLLSHVRLFGTPWTTERQASTSVTNCWSLLKLMSIELVMPSNHLILCCPLLLLPSIFPASGSFPMSQFFASDGQNIGVSASVWVLPMNIQGWFPLGLTDLFAVQGTLRTLLRHRSIKASVLWHSACFMGQLLHPYKTTGKTIALIRWTFVGKVMPLFFNMLSRLVIAFLLRSKHL